MASRRAAAIALSVAVTWADASKREIAASTTASAAGSIRGASGWVFAQPAASARAASPTGAHAQIRGERASGLPAWGNGMGVIELRLEDRIADLVLQCGGEYRPLEWRSQ